MLHGRRAIRGALAASALLIPWHVTAESSLQTGARTATTGASAHLDFRIVIPPVLALSVEPAGATAGSAARVTILSNTRHVLLSASAPEPAVGEAVAASRTARGTVFLGPRRGSVITAESACRRDAPRVVAQRGHRDTAPVVDLLPVVCTVTMP